MATATELRDDYIMIPGQRIVEGVTKLDLGCGRNPKEGFTGVDVDPDAKPAVLCDLGRDPWPFPDNSIEEAYSSHFIEHLTGEEFIHFMTELHRVLKPGAKAQLIAPYGMHRRAWQDPTHKRAIVEETFYYFNKAWRDENAPHVKTAADFDFQYGYNISDPRWTTASVEAQAFALRYYVNVAADLWATLTKRGA